MVDTDSTSMKQADISFLTSAGPRYVSIHSTGRCNLSCFMCWHNYVEDMHVTIEPEKLDPFLKIAEHVSFAGGEPFWLDKNINGTGRKILDRIMDRHPEVKLTAFTNGSLLKGDLAKLALSSFENVIFSIDTLDPDTYKKIRGKSMLGTVLANVEKLDELKRKSGLGRDDTPYIDVNSIVMDCTLEGLPEITKWLAEHGGRIHRFVKLQNIFDPAFQYVGVTQRLNKTTSPVEVGKTINAHALLLDSRVLKDDRQTAKKAAAVRSKLLEITASTGMVLDDRSHQLELSPRLTPASAGPESVCHQPWSTAYIHQNGDVFCCCTNSILLGNLGRSSFDEIWNGPAAQELRTSFLKGEMKGCVEGACESHVNYFKEVKSVNA